MLADWPYRMVRLACDHCPRRGQYRKEMLIARFGGDVLMPDVGHLIAQCAAVFRSRRLLRCVDRYGSPQIFIDIRK
jgi:hypothetical protein